MKIIIDNYEKWQDETNEINYDLEKICEEYAKKGGDEAMIQYEEWAKQANDIAEEYLEYASIEESNYSLSVNIISTYNDLGMVNNYMNYWDSEILYEIGDYVIYEDKTYICIDNTKSRLWNEEEERYEFNPEGWKEKQVENENIELVGQTNSKLSGFKAGKNYISVDNKIETPDYNEDWLWYYNIGDISYTESMTDELGNIMMIESTERQISTDSTETNLMLYGNVLTDITYENNKLTFTYVIGAHLTAVLKEIKTDDDGKERYYYDEFKYDEDDKYHGVVYTETYSVAKDSEIDILVDEGLFDIYVRTNKLLFKKKEDWDSEIIYKYGDYVIYEDTTYICIDSTKCRKWNKEEKRYEFDPEGWEEAINMSLHTEDISYARFKCPFMLKLLTVNRGVNSINSNFNYLPSSFKVNINKVRTEDLHMPITKLDYFTGTTYQPQVQADAHVNRGNATAWERHIKLGEIKTFQAMLDYANGGFFNIK